MRPETAQRRPSQDIPPNSHGLWSLWDMHEFLIKPLIGAMDVLVNCSAMIHSHHPGIYPKMTDRARADLARHVEKIIPQLAQSELDMCCKGAERLLAKLKSTDISTEIVADVDDLRRRILDQADTTFCLLLSPHEKRFYAKQAPIFGQEVEAKFPAMSEDIAEASKCLALNRSTSAVFHLMRVMEVGVRRFGNALDVELVDEKNWQNILDEINKKIRAMDHKQQKTKAFAEAASHLYNVKVAWRNETMHPKQTYSPDEAEAIFSNSHTFIRDLANLI